MCAGHPTYTHQPVYVCGATVGSQYLANAVYIHLEPHNCMSPTGTSAVPHNTQLVEKCDYIHNTLEMVCTGVSWRPF